MEIQVLPFTIDDINYFEQFIDSAEATDLWASRTYFYPLNHQMMRERIRLTTKNPIELLMFKILDKNRYYAGHVELDSFDHNSKVLRISRLFIASSFRKRGLATQTLKWIINYAFCDLIMNRLEITVFEENTHALALYEKLGFRREGLLREKMNVRGEKKNIWILGLLKSQYDEVFNCCHFMQSKNGVDEK